MEQGHGSNGDEERIQSLGEGEGLKEMEESF